MLDLYVLEQETLSIATNPEITALVWRKRQATMKCRKYRITHAFSEMFVINVLQTQAINAFFIFCNSLYLLWLLPLIQSHRFPAVAQQQRLVYHLDKSVVQRQFRQRDFTGSIPGCVVPLAKDKEMVHVPEASLVWIHHGKGRKKNPRLLFPVLVVMGSSRNALSNVFNIVVRTYFTNGHKK